MRNDSNGRFDADVYRLKFTGAYEDTCDEYASGAYYRCCISAALCKVSPVFDITDDK